MDKSFFKIFMSKTKERKWLNKMGEDGYLLNKVNDSQYSFTRNEDKKYNYSLEYLDCSPHSEQADEYFKACEVEGKKPVLASGNWIYFVKENGKITVTPESYSKNANFYFWRCVYLSFFGFMSAFLCGYQIYAAKYLPFIKFESDGRFNLLTINDKNASVLTEMLNVIKKWLNNIIEWFNNRYFKFFADIFGYSDASVCIACVVPIIIILVIVFALNFEQYLEFRALSGKKGFFQNIKFPWGSKRR